MAKKPTIAQLEGQIAALNDALEMSLAVSPVADNNFFGNNLSGMYDGSDRNSYDRKKIYAESLRAWRVNPIARRIVRLTRSFILGKGLEIKSKDEAAQKFLLSWWTDPLNKLKNNIPRWLDELTRTGNLFILCSVQENGMLYARAVPSEQIEKIETKDNDIEQEVCYYKDSTETDKWDAYQKNTDQATFMLHYSINRPVGSSWGEGDLAPLLVWIGRYSTWLEDRVRLNHFRSLFMFIMQGTFKSTAEKATRQKELNANPPKAGTVLVTDESEQWGILASKLDAFDASVDGIAIKKHILSGLGFPMHWFAEPEGSNRTTAEAAGTPTFRTLEESQDEVFDILADLARVALEVRSRKDATIKADAPIEIHGPDITERDNATLALALGRVYPHLADLLDRDGIEPDNFLRILYKMIAEVWTGETPKIKKKPLVKPSDQPAAPVTPTDPATDQTDPATEESAP